MNSQVALGSNLFLVGTAKAGTTSIADYLDQHPEIYISRPKEPNFFALPPNEVPLCHGPLDSGELSELLLGHSVTDPDDYQTLFSPGQEVSIRGDCSVRYLYSEDAVQRIYDYAPEARIVAILRDPVARMHSHYHMNVRLGVEPEPFPRALALEQQRIESDWGWDWHYTEVGRYCRQLKRYFEAFGRERVFVAFYEDFCQDPAQLMQSLFRFADVSDDAKPNTERRSNVGQTPRFRVLRKLLWEDNALKTAAKFAVPQPIRRAVSEWIEAKNRQAVPRLQPEMRRRLATAFDEEHRQLEELLGRKLPW